MPLHGGVRCTAKHKRSHPGRLRRKLETLGGCRADLADLADDARQPRLAQALLHRDEHIGIAARLDPDHTVGMKSDEIERRSEQVAPAQAPEDRAVQPGKDAGKEDRSGRFVAQRAAAGDLMQSARRQSRARQIIVDIRDTEGQRIVTRSDMLDAGDARAQFLDDGLMPHSSQDSDQCESFLLCSPRWGRESSRPRVYLF